MWKNFYFTGEELLNSGRPTLLRNIYVTEEVLLFYCGRTTPSLRATYRGRTTLLRKNFYFTEKCLLFYHGRPATLLWKYISPPVSAILLLGFLQAHRLGQPPPPAQCRYYGLATWYGMGHYIACHHKRVSLFVILKGVIDCHPERVSFFVIIKSFTIILKWFHCYPKKVSCLLS